jgi:sugar/nucleoside kinase (ribokinase family)
MLKLGERGMMTYTQANPTDLSGWFHLDSLTDDVVDRVGAGDALLAYASLALRVSNSPVQAAIIGSVAAAMECEFDGNVPIVNSDVIERLSRLEREVSFAP